MVPFADRPRDSERRFPIITWALIIANVLVFLYMLSLSPGQLNVLVRSFGTVPSAVTSSFVGWSTPGTYVTVFTALFIHGSVPHLVGNLIFLWVFGDNVESALGHLTFFALYLLAGFIASLTHILAFSTSILPTIGASGAIAGVLGAYLVLFPHAQLRVLLFFGPFFALGRVAALLLIFGWFVLQVFRGVGMMDQASAGIGGVAYWSHVGGFVTGLLLTAGIRAARHQPLGTFSGRFRLNWTFRNWLVAVVIFSLLMTLAGSLAGPLGPALQARVITLAALVALADGALRATRHHALLGEGRGAGRWVALLQVLVALVVVIATLV